MMRRSLERLIYYFVYLLVVWGSFRYFVRLPEVVSELWFKPVIWLTPLFWWRLSMKKRLDLFGGDTVKAILYGLSGGLFYFVALRYVLGSGILPSIDVLGTSLATAVVEEITFSGVILLLLVQEFKREGTALALTALGYALVSLPINIFVNQLTPMALVGVFLLAFFVSLTNGFLRLRANNVLAAIVAHFIFLVTILSA